MLRALDPLGNLHLLLPGQQWHLAHLLEIHPDRVVQDVQARFVLLLLRLRLLDSVHLGLVNDLHLEIAQLDVNLVQILRRNDRVGQGVVDVVVSQVALFLREADEFLDFLGQIQAGLALDGSDRRPGLG